MTKRATTAQYYGNSHLKPWDARRAIQARVDRESFVQDTYVAPKPLQPLIDSLKPSVGLANMFKNFVYVFRP